MDSPLLYDIVESPSHPDLGPLSRELGLRRIVFNAQRKALNSLRREPPDRVVADFFYGYGNNYAGANVSNLDVLLRSLQRFAPSARIIVLAGPGEIAHIPQLTALFDLHAVIALPADPAELRTALR